MNFKELTFKKKIEHIWEYYRWWILGIIFLIFMASSLLHYVLAPKMDLYAGLCVYVDHVSDTNYNNLYNTLNTEVDLPENTEVQVINCFLNDDITFNANMHQKLNTLIWSQEINVVVTPETDIDTFVSSEYLIPLTNIYSEEELAVFEEKDLVYYAIDPEDEIEKPFAINTSPSTLLSSDGMLDEGTHFVGVIALYDKIDNSRAVLDVLLK